LRFLHPFVEGGNNHAQVYRPAQDFNLLQRLVKSFAALWRFLYYKLDLCRLRSMQTKLIIFIF